MSSKVEMKTTQIATCTWELEQKKKKQNQDELLVNLTVPTNNTNTQTQKINPFFYTQKMEVKFRVCLKLKKKNF